MKAKSFVWIQGAFYPIEFLIKTASGRAYLLEMTNKGKGGIRFYF